MHVIVIGAGVIGISTAYELLKRGCKVTIVDRRSKPALETSYGNAGFIAPGHSYSWISPFTLDILKNSKKTNFKIRLQRDIHFWRWSMQFLNQCRKKNIFENSVRKYKFGKYSQKCLNKIKNDIKFNFHENNRGLIYFYRSRESLNKNKKTLWRINNLIENLELLNKEEICTLEPALNKIKQNIYGGIYCKSDMSGSCMHYTLKLEKVCRKMGAHFYYNTNIVDFIKNKNKINSVCTTNKNMHADLFVIACASSSYFLAKKNHEYLPIYPIKGFSITVPIINKNLAPLYCGIDEDNLLAFSVMGNKMRFTSGAEISNYDLKFYKKNFIKLINNAKSLFPNACDFSKIEYWTGLRPMTPDGMPIIKKSKLNNLYYNTGHGNLGWTMSAGSAVKLSSLIFNTDC